MEPGVKESDLSLIDCDVHLTTDVEEPITERLPPRYQDRGLTLAIDGYAHPHGRRLKDTGQGWSEYTTPERTKKFLLDEYDEDFGIITGSTLMMYLSHHPNRDYAAALAQAHNEWVREEWLPTDDRLVGSIMVPPQYPERAVEMIEEFGSDPDFVQVIMGSAARESYGKPQYWPIYEAAADKGLPVAIHVNGAGAGTSIHPSPSPPSTYFEFHSGHPMTYMGQVMSMVLEGTFEKYPDLKFVCIEGGFGWVPHVMWRLDKNWRGLKEQTPWLERPPSEYIREHVRFTTQPIEEPEKPEHLLQIFEMMHADETLMFSSDFPHWDGDDPVKTLPGRMSEEMRRRIMYENAAELYGL